MNRDDILREQKVMASAYKAGLVDGYEAAVRDFWRGVCERMAMERDEWAAEDRAHYGNYGKEIVAKREAEAAQLRTWAAS